MHTNRIKGPWKDANDHFKRTSITRINQFEGHLVDIMCRSAVKSDVYMSFFDIVKFVYPLDKPVKPHCLTIGPVFQTPSYQIGY